MPDSDAIDFFPAGPGLVRPFVHEADRLVSLHFEIGEIQSRMRRDDPTALELDYTRAMMAFLLLAPAPRSLLMVGLGGGSLPKYCHRHLPQARITVVEINPHVIALRDTFEVPPDGPRFGVLQGDGAEVVAQARACHDVLLVDGFDYDGQPPALCTQRFYDDCAGALDAGGVMVVNLHAGASDCDALVARIGCSFGTEPLSFLAADGGNRIVVAARSATLEQAARSFDERWAALAPVHRRTLRGSTARLSRALQGRLRAPLTEAP